MKTNEQVLVSAHKDTILQGQNNFDINEKKEKKIPVVEVFGPTIEGEGAVSGSQTIFIRFGLCDYKCKKCDSWHAVDPDLVRIGATWRTQQEIFVDVMRFMHSQNAQHIDVITFSGGNPAIHDLSELVDLFQAAGKKIIVETQGTKHPEWLRKVNHLVISPKAPGMGEVFNPTVFSEFFHSVVHHVEDYSIKIVVFSAQDLEFAAGVVDILDNIYCNLNLAHVYKTRFYLSLGNLLPPVFYAVIDPTDGKPVIAQDDQDAKALVSELLLRYNQLAEDIMKDSRLAFVKFLPQLHVLVYGNETGK